MRVAPGLALVVGMWSLLVLAGPSSAEQGGSGVRSHQAGMLDAGVDRSCAVLDSGELRCWGGFGAPLGLVGVFTLGENETPATAPPVDLGPGRGARSVATGAAHTCAILDDGAVRCWGSGFQGRPGLGNTQVIGDDETPGSAPTVDLGAGRTAAAITAAEAHSCTILDDGDVRCWGGNDTGQLGLGTTVDVGDDETPASVPPVDLGAGRTATAIAAGGFHTCAILDDGHVRCWGRNDQGQLGRGNTRTIGDDEAPSGAGGDVDLGPGRTAVAVAAGDAHSCALLDDGAVRCWGANGSGQLGLGSTRTVGDDEAPTAVAPVDLGAAAVAVAADNRRSCAVLADATVRCWGNNTSGILAVGSTAPAIGDDESPAAAGRVDLGRPVLALALGISHGCALLDDGGVRCFGLGNFGALGYGNTGGSSAKIGDDEPAGAGGPVNLLGVLPVTVADVSLTATPATPTYVPGESLAVDLELRNAGPDSATGVVVGLGVEHVDGVVLRAPSGTTIASGTWRVPRLGPGRAATLRVTFVTRTRARPRITAEVVHLGRRDPDSQPADADPAEDDSVELRPVRRALPRRLTLSFLIGPASGGRTRLDLSGRLDLPSGVPLADACRGLVRIDVTLDGRQAATPAVPLAVDGGRCTYARSGVARVPSGTAVSLRARFGGNGFLLAAASRARSFTVP